MKTKFRKDFLSQRLNLNIEEYKKLNKNIFDRILKILSKKNFNSIAMYYPFKKEVDLLKLMDVLKDKDILFPKVFGKEMEFIKINSLNDFKKGKFGIMEPEGEFYDKQIDIYLIPGLAFDKQLYRLGYGGGYFDKYFAKHQRTLLIGVCFDFQILEKLPILNHDIKMDMIVTEKRILKGE